MQFDDIFYSIASYHDVFLFDYLCCVFLTNVHNIYDGVGFKVMEYLIEHYSALSQWQIGNIYIFVAVLSRTMMFPIYIYYRRYIRHYFFVVPQKFIIRQLHVGIQIVMY